MPRGRHFTPYPSRDFAELQAMALSAIAGSSGRRFRARGSSDCLRRLSEGAQEGAAHAVAIGEARFPSDDDDRMAALLHHQPGSLDPQVLDRPGRRLPGLVAESATELARTQVRRLGEQSNRQRLIEIALRVGQRVVNPNIVPAQIEGAIIFGVTAALYGEITLKNRRVEQAKFSTNRPIHLKHGV